MPSPSSQPALVFAPAAAANHAYQEYIESLPGKLMREEWARYAKMAGGANKWAFPPLATADHNPTVKMSPDVLYSLLSYDVGEKPLRISAPVSRDPYLVVNAFPVEHGQFLWYR